MTLTLEILVPDGVVMQGPIGTVQAVDASGSFGLLPGHEDFCTVLVPSVLSYRDGSGQTHFAAVDGGVLLLERGQVSVVTQDAVVADQLELVVDAAAQMLAQRQGQERAARAAFADLVAALLREMPEAEPRR
jgi:F-type H+-transporting ATPase subunit epsilon